MVALINVYTCLFLALSDLIFHLEDTGETELRSSDQQTSPLADKN